jgi:glycosyltransferase involved in cell wall biosynthesis
VRKVDVVIGTSPQFFTAVAAYFVGLVKRKPFVFELRDFWPESIKGLGLMGDSKVFRFLEAVELFLYRKSAYIIPVTYSFKKELMSRGIDGNKIGVVTNGVDVSRFSPRPKNEKLIVQHDLQNKFVVGYIGTHGMSQALETVLKAAQLAKTFEGGDSLHFLLLGSGAEKNALMDLAVEMKLDNVTFVDGVSKDKVANYWSILDVAVIHLRRIPLFTSIIPSKLFECMGMGIPVLHGVEGESANIVNKERVGITFTPESEVELLDNIRRLQNDPILYQEFRDNSLLAAHKFDRAELAEKMLLMLKAI